MLPAAGRYLDMFDEEHTLLADVEHPSYGGIRVPDGRALAWAEYGSARGVPVILIPDAGSSRLAPQWLLHDSALPSSIRLLALDRPGTGASDAIGLGGLDDPAEDLRHMVETLAVGRVAVIGIGQGAHEAFALAAAHPHLVTTVVAVSIRLSEPAAARRSLRHPFTTRRATVGGGLAQVWQSAAVGADLREESTWHRMLYRLPGHAAAGLGDRWQEADFRASVVADVSQAGHSWSGVGGEPQPTPVWVTDPESMAVPVQLWHGTAEFPTGLDEVKALVSGRSGWQLSAVAGPTATLGFWPQILASAAHSFRAMTAA